MNKVWGGRFKKPTNPWVEKFTHSLNYDQRLSKMDILGSIAHVQTLTQAKVISRLDEKKIIRGLKKIQKLIQENKFPDKNRYEDIHSAIEGKLVSLIGKIGKQLHTGRSRNDQVATDFYLFLKLAIHNIMDLLLKMIAELANRASKERETIMPGYTHLQRAMPVTLGHYLASYAFMLGRDVERLKDLYARADRLPLGVGALAGTNFPLDRAREAVRLGFSSIIENSLDAVSDRDVFIEFLSSLSLVQMHLSRMSEDLILWNSTEFNFIQLDDAFATGSSLMPQKKNPDVPELVRGKSGRVYGNLLGLLTVMKGLPLSYNRDLQEDKEFIFDSYDTVSMSLEVMIRFFKTLRFNRSKMQEAVESDRGILATDVADLLVQSRVPFREAHEIVGKMIQYCLIYDKRIQDLSASEVQKFTTSITFEKFKKLNLRTSIHQKKSIGGTAPSNVDRQIQQLTLFIQKTRKWVNQIKIGTKYGATSI